MSNELSKPTLWGRFRRLFVTDSIAANPVKRSDQWVNGYTGLGTSRDKTGASMFWWNGPVPDNELEGLYWNNDIAAKIIEKLPKACFRAGYKIKNDDDGDLKKAFTDRHVHEAWLEAANLGRAFGGSILWVGVADGKQPAEPCDLNAAQDFNFLIPMDRRYVRVHQYYTDPSDPKYSQPELYLVADPTTALVAVIHETRTIRFEGIKTDRRLRQVLRGWGFSVLQRAYEVLSDYGQTFQSITNLMLDANQGVFKIKDLIGQLGNDANAVQQRMAIVDLMRSSARAIMLDSDSEDFQRMPTNFSGLADIMEMMMLRVSSAADMPQTLLFGRAPAGMDATGASDMQQWADNIREMQHTYTEGLTTLLGIVARAEGLPDDVEIEWCNPDQADASEEADIRLKVSQADSSDIAAGILLPEEVAISRWGSGKYSTDTEIDVDARQKSLEMSLKDMSDPEAPKPGADPNGEGNAGSPVKESVGNLTDDSPGAVGGQGGGKDAASNIHVTVNTGGAMPKNA